MDGLAKTQDHVFILAASNLPWELDIAMLRRLEKRILIGLPDLDARMAMFQQNLPAGQTDAHGQLLVDNLNYIELAEKTQGYSGADIQLVCKEAAMKPLRKVFDLLDSLSLDEGGESTEETKQEGQKSSKYIHNIIIFYCSSKTIVSMVREPVLQDDVLEAIQTTRPSSDANLNQKYLEWQKQFGSS